MPNDKQEITQPPQFADASGRKWTIKLTFGLIDRIAEKTGVDLAGENGGEADQLIRLLFNRRLLAKTLWLALEEQAQAASVSEADFRAQLDGDVLTAAWGGLVDAVSFFIPLAFRATFLADVERMATTYAEGLQEVTKILDGSEHKATTIKEIKKIGQKVVSDALSASAN